VIHVGSAHCRREQGTCDKGSRRRSEQKTLTTCEAKLFPHGLGAIGSVDGRACPTEGGYIPRTRSGADGRRGVPLRPADHGRMGRIRASTPPGRRPSRQATLVRPSAQELRSCTIGPGGGMSSGSSSSAKFALSSWASLHHDLRRDSETGRDREIEWRTVSSRSPARSRTLAAYSERATHVTVKVFFPLFTTSATVQAAPCGLRMRLPSLGASRMCRSSLESGHRNKIRTGGGAIHLLSLDRVIAKLRASWFRIPLPR